MARAINEVVGFSELRWLQELNSRRRKGTMPELIRARLLKRGLIERTTHGVTLTARGRIALARLG